ncbi:MAG: hypothetical protein JW888_18880, partial [Pirellulales bacterium]|nr:hypothetical protein [Pirellulales bacterium]
VSLLIVLVTRPEPPVKIVERIVRVPAENPTEDGVAGAERSGAPGNRAFVDLPAYPLRYPIPERSSVLAAVFFGPSDDFGSPIRPARNRPRWADWNAPDDFDSMSRPAMPRSSTVPKPLKSKSYREIFDELIKNHG